MLLRGLTEGSPLPDLLGKLQTQKELISKVILPEFINPNETSPKFKNIGDMWYDDEQHIYFNKSTLTPIISTTTLLGSLQEEFNTVTKSIQCAGKDSYTCENLDVSSWTFLSLIERADRIKEAWRITNVTGTTYGSMGHTIFEHGAKNRRLPIEDVYYFGRDMYNLEHPILYYFAQDLFTNYFPKFSRFEVLVEPLLHLQGMMAGQADLVLLDHINKVIHILDYKTNKHKPGSAEDKSYDKFKYVITHLKKNSLSEYQLQLCLYQWMVALMYPGYSLGSNFILWGNRDTGKMETIEIAPKDHHNDLCLIYKFLTTNSQQLKLAA